jgi:hypothetical protein
MSRWRLPWPCPPRTPRPACDRSRREQPSARRTESLPLRYGLTRPRYLPRATRSQVLPAARDAPRQRLRARWSRRAPRSRQPVRRVGASVPGVAAALLLPDTKAAPTPRTTNELVLDASTAPLSTRRCPQAAKGHYGRSERHLPAAVNHEGASCSPRAPGMPRRPSQASENRDLRVVVVCLDARAHLRSASSPRRRRSPRRLVRSDFSMYRSRRDRPRSRIRFVARSQKISREHAVDASPRADMIERSPSPLARVSVISLAVAGISPAVIRTLGGEHSHRTSRRAR